MKLYKCSMKTREAYKTKEKITNLNEQKTVRNMVQIKQFQ